jgi:hypothetical protein
LIVGGVEPELSRPSQGWHITVYYTPVESFYGGKSVSVTGCLRIEGSHGKDHLGTYPRTFVERAKQEGTGRITSGQHAGRYLNWSHDTGYWLDDAPRDSYGRRLEPFVSAAADGSVLRKGTRFRLAHPGRLEEGDAVPAHVARRFRDTVWEVRDEFTPGLGGDKHIDLYIGEQTHARFEEEDPMYTTLVRAAIHIHEGLGRRAGSGG